MAALISSCLECKKCLSNNRKRLLSYVVTNMDYYFDALTSTKVLFLPHRTSMYVEPAVRRGGAKPVGAKTLKEKRFRI